MRLKSITLTGLLLCFTVFAFAQRLYEPRNIQHAYHNNTRDKSGAPGDNYWQNTATYTITVELAPPKRLVKGEEKIIYSNNSPDTLQKLNFKLIVNSHKPGSPRGRRVPEAFLTSGIHIDAFKVDGQPQEWNEQPMDGTNKFVKLPKPLLPGEQVELDIRWHYKLSKVAGREGAISQHTFFLAYFYPRVAVYDDYNGWDRMPHILSQEFYNDFNDYTVKVTVPKNFIVWGTGLLQNPEEVLQSRFAELFKKSKTSDSLIHIVTETDLSAQDITTQHSTNTWVFTADNITDVTLAVSDQYKWDASSVKLDNGRRVSVQAAYDAPSTDFEQMVTFGKHAVKWFSEHAPGVPYPFPKLVAVRGHADMEYPMLINDSSHPDNPIFTRFVAEHEIAHMYFPFYMGTNQTRFGFMDEGWATTFEYLIGIADLGKAQAAENFKRFRVNSWINDPSFAHELPIITPTNLLSRPAMSDNEYGKAALAYLALRDMLGHKSFQTVLHGYMARWNGKHPMPWDFFYSFNDLSGENLNWFWNNWFFSHNYIDLALNKVTTHRNNLTLTIENIGGFAVPFDVVVQAKDGSVKRFHQTPKVWESQQKQLELSVKYRGDIQKISLESGIFMDADLSNNSWLN